MDTLLEGYHASGAQFSHDSIYRYALTRQWSDGPCVAFLMFNPSTANAADDDPTIRRCIGFARRWGYGRLVILNLYAIRGTDPKTPSRTLDPVGPLNDYWIEEVCGEAREIICAWGCAQHMKSIGDRISTVMEIFKYRSPKVSCLGYRKDGHPRHPLMLHYDTPREPFTWRS
jgi:hypothetical protein